MRPQSAPITLKVRAGEAYALMGRAGSGKTHLLEAIKGGAKLTKGTVSVNGDYVDSGREFLAWRLTPQGWARRLAGKHRTTGSAEALTACGLWDVRKSLISHLTPSQVAACEILPLLLREGQLLLSDGGFDLIDPFVLDDALALFVERLQRGAAAVVATHRPDVAETLGNMIALGSGGKVFVGTCSELRAQAAPNKLIVTTEDGSTVRAIAEPFAIDVQETEQGLEITCPDGQELAARLLTQGYGSVRMVTIRRPSIQDALKSLG